MKNSTERIAYQIPFGERLITVTVGLAEHIPSDDGWHGSIQRVAQALGFKAVRRLVGKGRRRTFKETSEAHYEITLEMPPVTVAQLAGSSDMAKTLSPALDMALEKIKEDWKGRVMAAYIIGGKDPGSIESN